MKFLEHLRPYKRHPLQRRHQQQQTKRYWFNRQKWRQVRFWFANRFFRFRSWHQSQLDSVWVLNTLVKVILPQSVLAATLVFGLEAIEYFLIEVTSLPSLLAYYFPKLVITPDAYAGLSTVLIDLTGSFLALYFTAITVVASTVYGEVPDDVRRLLIEEKFGNVYFRTVALLGAISVLIAGLMALGYEPGVLLLCLIVVLAIFSVLSFVVLGLKALNFFNPTPLLHYLDRDFTKWALSATPKGLMWHDSSFQSHYQRKAEETLYTYGNIIRLVTAKKGMGPEPVNQTVSHALRLLRTYAGIKRLIPSQSLWYRRIGEFQDWLLADHLEINIALSTGTGLRQEAIPNPLWVEEELQDVIRAGIKEFVDDEDWQNTVDLLNQWQNALGTISIQWGIPEAKILFQALGSLIRAKIVQSDEQVLMADDEHHALGMRLAVLDLYQLGYLQILLGFLKRLESFRSEQLVEWLEGIEWVKQNGVYGNHLPQELLIQLENLRMNLEFEYMAEGRHVTPVWYQQQLIAAGFAKYAVDMVSSFIEDISVNFVAESERMIENKNTFFAVQTCERGIEAISKGSLCIYQSQQCLERLKVFHHPLDFHLVNIRWPEVEWGDMEQKLGEYHQRLLVVLGKAVPIVMDLPRTKHVPDMLGRIYSVLAEGCIESLSLGQRETFEKLFRHYFISAVASYQRLSNHYYNQDIYGKFIRITDPLIDIMEVSGYACVYSELHSEDYWATVKKTWSWYLGNVDNGSIRVGLIEAVANAKDEQFMLTTQRDLVRIGWKQAFGSHMRELKIEDDFINTRFGGQSRLLKQPPLIQALLSGSISSIPSIDLYSVFQAMYFDNNPLVPEFKLPSKAREFRSRLQRRDLKAGKEGDDELAEAE